MYNRDIAAQCTRQMLQGEKPDAIFVGNDHMAFAVLDEIRAAGLTIGKDISVVGYDDVPMAAWASYDLTTYRQPVNRMVDATVDLMLDQVETGRLNTEQVEIAGELIIRSSARLPKGRHA